MVLLATSTDFWHRLYYIDINKVFKVFFLPLLTWKWYQRTLRCYAYPSFLPHSSRTYCVHTHVRTTARTLSPCSMRSPSPSGTPSGSWPSQPRSSTPEATISSDIASLGDGYKMGYDRVRSLNIIQRHDVLISLKTQFNYEEKKNILKIFFSDMIKGESKAFIFVIGKKMKYSTFGKAI